jgi:hypothetical protein
MTKFSFSCFIIFAECLILFGSFFSILRHHNLSIARFFFFLSIS